MKSKNKSTGKSLHLDSITLKHIKEVIIHARLLLRSSNPNSIMEVQCLLKDLEVEIDKIIK